MNTPSSTKAHNTYTTFGETVFSYSRKEAIADGTLVDVTETAKEAGFRIPVAITAAAWEDCVAWDRDDNTRKGTANDQEGRLWDVLWMAWNAAIRNRDTSAFHFQVFRVPRQGRGHMPRMTTLSALCHGGDQGEPLVTIMMPGED